MHAHQAALSLRRTVRLVVALALLVAAVGSPLRADSDLDGHPLCREDGVCLPDPVAATQAAIQGLAVEPDAVAEPSCDNPLLVKREAEVDPRDFQRLLQRRGYAQIEGLLTPQWWRVCLADDGPSATSADLAALVALPEVEYAEPDGIAYAAWTPNDPYYDDLVQWPLPKIGAPAAWDTTLGSTDVMIAVIDSGVDYYHPDSPEHLWLGCNMIYQSTHPGQCGDVLDDYGHGTHVTGIAAARSNNGVGVAGLCPGCSVLAIKVLSSAGTGNWSAVANGITYAAEHYRPAAQRLVISLSLGGGEDSKSYMVAEAISAALAQGALVFAAAGNYGPAAPMFPASLPSVVAVSATDSADRPALTTTPDVYFSSQYGDLGAPGVFVFSTMPLWANTIGPYGEPPYYRYMSGTSMASPHVAAAAGLVWSVHPEYDPLQVRFALYGSVHVPADWDPAYGVGRLNVAGAVSHPPIVIRHLYLPLVVR